MAELHSHLMREFEDDPPVGPDPPPNDHLVSRLSRHRSSLNKQYNLNNNSMF